MSTAPVRTVNLKGVAEAWRRGNSVRRRELLATLFTGLITRDGMVVEYVARPEREAEVVELMTAAFADLAKSGKGGIRTLEGALHPLPA